MEKLSIGKMAALNQVSVQTLRLYDQMGILAPIEVNQETGYRYYDIKQSGQLDMIRYMKASGMTLKEIRQVFENRDYALLNDVLNRRMEEIDRKIEAMILQKKAVKRMIDSYDRYLKSPRDGILTLEYIGERKLYPQRTEQNFYELGLEAYENMLKDLKKEMKAHDVSEFYYYNAGTTIARDDFIQGRCVSDQIFVFVDQDCTSRYLQAVPAGMFACIYCDDFDKEAGYIRELHQFIRKNQMEVTGDYICEVLTELPIIQSRKREMFLRLQVPVRVEGSVMTGKL
ncbi:MAG TPA: MerR family transcriptional regulator [Candidatus Ventrimonas merdavium]|nr:MerR family transcriptional regulator [Candidatus Ventrimonas merdavium]